MSNSIAIRQFVALARGELRVQTPGNPFRVERVQEEEFYCLRCYGVHKFDVVYAAPSAPYPTRAVARMCRCCGAMVGKRLAVGG